MEKCPKCGSEYFMRERRPNGFSMCSECDYRGLSTEWIKINDEEESEKRKGLRMTSENKARVWTLLDSGNDWYIEGPRPNKEIVENIPVIEKSYADQLERENRELTEKNKVFWENRKCLEKEMSRLSKSYNFDQQQIRDLKEENQKLREALEFYADENNWNTEGFPKDFCLIFDSIKDDYSATNYELSKFGGKRAREVLNG